MDSLHYIPITVNTFLGPRLFYDVCSLFPGSHHVHFSRRFQLLQQELFAEYETIQNGDPGHE